jgi:hypothetical protein
MAAEKKEAVQAGRETGRGGVGTGVIRRLVARAIMSTLALSRQFAFVRVRFTQGLKIRVSAVRFCPWPPRSSTTTYAPPTRPRRATPLGDIPGDSCGRGRVAPTDLPPDIWGSRAILAALRVIG